MSLWLAAAIVVAHLSWLSSVGLGWCRLSSSVCGWLVLFVIARLSQLAGAICRHPSGIAIVQCAWLVLLPSSSVVAGWCCCHRPATVVVVIVAGCHTPAFVVCLQVQLSTLSIATAAAAASQDGCCCSFCN
jgi:hypothetical protein